MMTKTLKSVLAGGVAACVVALLLPVLMPNSILAPLISGIVLIVVLVSLTFVALFYAEQYADRMAEAATAEADRDFPGWRDQVRAAHDAALLAVMDWQRTTFGEATNAFSVSFVNRGTELDTASFARNVPTDLLDHDGVAKTRPDPEISRFRRDFENDGTGLLERIAHTTPEQFEALRMAVGTAMFSVMRRQDYAALAKTGVLPGGAQTAPYRRTSHYLLCPVTIPAA